MRSKISSIIIALCAIYLAGCEKGGSEAVTIGIIEPLEHTAMNEIVAGFSETLHQLYQKPIIIKIENAQGDANLERAIIQKMRDANYTMIVPIGVGTTEMSLAMLHAQPIVSLASDLEDKTRQAMHPCHATAVHDEISAEQVLGFIHRAYPALTHLTLIHSAADKVFPEVEEAIRAGKKYGITIDHRMVATLPELYAVAQNLPNNTQGFFILKDSLIASGAATLAKAAALRQIPFITSDQGSVQDGATFALGVHERDIGVEGGKLAAAILNGKLICETPITSMNHLTVFINTTAMAQTKQPMAIVQAAAQALHYQIEIVDAKRS